MPRLVPVNTEFAATLRRYEAAPDLVAGLRSALAVAPGDSLAAEDYPLYGYHLRSSATQLLGYFITPGRFIRYEVAGGESLTITVPIERIRRVVERAGARTLTVTIEIDADTATATTEAQLATRPDPDSRDDDRLGRLVAVTRTTATVYEITAEAPENPTAGVDGGTDLADLARFSTALRASLGL